MSTPSHPSSIDPRSRMEDRDLESLEGDVPSTKSYEKSARSPTSLEKKAGKDWLKKGKSRKSHQRSRRGEDHEEDNVSLSPPSRSGRNRNAEVSSHGSASVGSGAARRCEAESSPESIGAFAVAGLNEPRDDTTDIDTTLDDASPPPAPESQQAVIAQAITREDLANEMREELRSEIRQEMRAFQSQAVAAEVIDVRVATGSVGEDPPDVTQSFDQSDQPDEKPFWKKKWFIVATIVLLIAAVAGSVGAVVGGKTDSNVAESTDVPISDEPSPPPTLIPPVSGSPTPTMMMLDTSPPTTPPVTSSPTLSPTLPPTAPETNPPTPPPTTSPTTSAPRTTPFPTFTPADVSFQQTVRGIDEQGRFGVDVKISRDGSTMAVGAINKNTVLTYRRNGNQWNRLGQILKFGGSFGGRLDLSEDGNILVVGARSENNVAGQVRAFRYSDSGDEWLPRGSPINGRAAGDEFGFDVSVSNSGRTMAVTSRLGDPSEDRMNAGYAKIFTFSGDWVQLGQDLEGEAALEQFGRSISVDASGRRVAVGASNGAQSKGSVRVFDLAADGSVWNPVGQRLDGEAYEDSQGTSVTFSSDGSILAIGADGNSRNGSQAGMVRVYELSEGTWIQRGQSILGEGAFGKLGSTHLSLSNDGNLLAAGAQDLNDEQGAAYLYRYNADADRWFQVSRFVGDSIGDEFGFSVSLSGDGKYFAVGAPDVGVGYARVYLVE